MHNKFGIVQMFKNVILLYKLVKVLKMYKHYLFVFEPRRKICKRFHIKENKEMNKNDMLRR